MTTTPREEKEMTDRRVTVNSDLGESYGLHSFGNDEPLLDLIDAANVACGYHSGDPDTMRQTVENAVRRGIDVGAHPGLPDPVGFGRRAMTLTPEEVEALVLYQVGALSGFLARSGGRLTHIKPHGALYGMVGRDADLMHAVVTVAELYGVGVYGMPGGIHQQVAESRGVPFTRELYVDLDYRADGSLVILRRPQPVDPEAAADRVRQALEEGTVRSVDGTLIEVPFDSVCVHSDTTNAPEVARAVARALAGAPSNREAASA
jgi:5-oxoprolinase (ATP-hydrolysing) subunit A